MKILVSSRIIKLKTVIKQNKYAFLIVIFWFLLHYLYFTVVTSDSMEALLVLLYFKPHESLYGNFYASFTEFIIFGLVFSVITIELFKKYNPAETCRELARNSSNHIVIIGYTHIGKRIVEFLKENSKLSIVVIEKDKELVQELIDNEKAVVNDDALNMETLKDASIEKAKAVFVLSDDLEVQLVVNANIRELNKSCHLVCRVFEDDIGDLITKTYNAYVISTSRFAAQIISNKIKKYRSENILLIGLNHISYRILGDLKSRSDIKYQIIEEDEEIVEEFMLSKESIVIGDPKDPDILDDIKIQEIDYVINNIPDVTNSILITRAIREKNEKCKIISRFFMDSVAEILENPPFVSKVLSSSKQTIKIMIDEGLFNF